ncbi:Ubiquitin-protein ligase [Phaffia rhodozyma]|uniref:Ubiquitin-protein ligase n=1 Tax=Phaffia rhodozyma TaxID=264483 RepID=A0A0F7SQD9_PHARH|nr:Ubiquitin-protein ligase [Phaffia rhodozyma]
MFKTVAVPSATAIKRINKEISALSKETDLGGIVLQPSDQDITRWTCVLPGPIGSVYEGGQFHVSVQLPPDYPFSAPKLQFLTKVSSSSSLFQIDLTTKTEPNDFGALLCFAAYRYITVISQMILSLSSLLTDPNPLDPLVPSIAQAYQVNRTQHDTTAREWVKLYAQKRQSTPSAPSASPLELASSVSLPNRLARSARLPGLWPYRSSSTASSSSPTDLTTRSGPTTIAPTETVLARRKRPSFPSAGTGTGEGAPSGSEQGAVINIDDSDDEVDQSLVAESNVLTNPSSTTTTTATATATATAAAAAAAAATTTTTTRSQPQTQSQSKQEQEIEAEESGSGGRKKIRLSEIESKVKGDDEPCPIPSAGPDASPTDRALNRQMNDGSDMNTDDTEVIVLD